jgi:A/G-specific adenine glycosylase
MTVSPKDLRQSLLHWYDANARTLPWRISPSQRALGVIPNPYHVWLSEIMLQQTTIVTVKPYFDRFLSAFPTIEHLAHAQLDAVLALWAGLGYYARGRNLHACALAIVKAGGFPKSSQDLLQFPGIGPYTAAAIASIAFDFPCVPVDGNVERVLSRLLRIEAALPGGKPAFREAARQFENEYRPGDFAQALMDLGSTVCTPRNPSCATCPWSASCLAAARGDAESFPIKTAKKPKPIRYGVAFVDVNDDGILVARRPNTGLLGGMLEVPGTEWRAGIWAFEEAVACVSLPKLGWQQGDLVRHIFTHFDLRLGVFVVRKEGRDNAQRISLSDLDVVALPSVMLKVIKSGLATLAASNA